MVDGVMGAVTKPRKTNGTVTAVQVTAWAKAGGTGRHSVGNRLYLLVRDTSANWVLRYRVGGRVRDMGLGRYDGAGKDGLTLAAARAKASKELAALDHGGIDPVEARREKAAAAKAAKPAPTLPTFREVAEQFIAGREAGWRNAKHAWQWSATLNNHAYPVIGDKPVADVTTDDVLAILQPIWHAKPETASRVRGRIEAILDAAKVRGLRNGENPALWRGHLALILPPKSKVRPVAHHPALPWKQAPAFMADAATRTGRAWPLIRFAILTAARSGEVRMARWREFDLAERVWTIPGERMKAGREHRVPLTDAAVAILTAIRTMLGGKLGLDGDPDPGRLIFPATHGGTLSDTVATMALRRGGWRDASGETVTLHGFRSTFRDWAAEATGHSDAVAEAALAHAVGDKVVAAYQRGDLFEKRRRLMEDWANYLTKPRPQVVRPRFGQKRSAHEVVA